MLLSIPLEMVLEILKCLKPSERVPCKFTCKILLELSNDADKRELQNLESKCFWCDFDGLESIRIAKREKRFKWKKCDHEIKYHSCSIVAHNCKCYEPDAPYVQVPSGEYFDQQRNYTNYVAKTGNLTLLTWAIGRGFNVNIRIFESASRSGNIETLEWTIKNYCKKKDFWVYWDDILIEPEHAIHFSDACSSKMPNGHYPFRYRDGIFISAIKSGSMPMLEWVLGLYKTPPHPADLMIHCPSYDAVKEMTSLLVGNRDGDRLSMVLNSHLNEEGALIGLVRGYMEWETAGVVMEHMEKSQHNPLFLFTEFIEKKLTGKTHYSPECDPQPCPKKTRL